MAFLIYIFTALLLVLGVIAAYYDFVKGIIPNKIVFSGILIGVGLYFIMFFYNSFFLHSKELFNYLPLALLNGAISILVGYCLWHFNFWSAGDGKLFGMYGLLLPLEFYSKTYIDYFPAFALLVNLFVPLLAVMLVQILIMTIKRRKEFWESIRAYKITFEKIKKFGIKLFKFFTDFLFVFIFIRALYLLFAQFGVSLNPLLAFLFLILFFYYFRKYRKKYDMISIAKYFVVFGVVGYLLKIEAYGKLYNYFKIVLVFIFLFIFIRKLFNFYIKKEETEKIKAKEVEEGMILTKEWKRYFSEKISKLTKNDKHEHFKEVEAEGLTKRQAEIIRELFNDDPNYEVEICNSIPFAPLLFSAAIISIATSSSFIPYFSKFLDYIIKF